jgi:hypothetical protein
MHPFACREAAIVFGFQQSRRVSARDVQALHLRFRSLNSTAHETIA